MPAHDLSSDDRTEGRRVYAVGDVHGRLDLLRDMLGRIRGDLAERPHPQPHIVMLGDYMDRGPDSRGVLEALIALKASDQPVTFLLGNHDSYVREYIERPEWFDRPLHWLHGRMGGAATLHSYGVPDATEHDPAATRDAFAAAFPADHLAFLDACELWKRFGAYVFAHAGIRPGVAMERQDRDDLIWIREPFLSSTRDFGFKVVHGHTIVPMVEHLPNRIAVDTGAVRSGVLSCVVLEGDAVELIQTGQPLAPLPEEKPDGGGLTGALRGLFGRH
jgi:serine/threonine protein phosphatase 1